MTAVELLKAQAELAYADVLGSLEGVTEAQSWAVLPQGGSDYLNTDGSIHGIALHLAVCKKMYGSIGFRETEVRWRDLAEQVAGFEPSWKAAFEYLEESQKYWLDSWESLTDPDLDRDTPHFSGKTWPAWKIIRMVAHHDSYHAGQIAVLRYAVGESSQPPPSVAEDIRTYCKDLASW